MERCESQKKGKEKEEIKKGERDAMFFGGGYAERTLAELAASADVVLVPIAGPQIDKMLVKYSFLSRDRIPDEIYQGVEGVDTIAVGAQWLTSWDQDNDLIYQITKALWNDNTRKLLDVGHAKGASVTRKTALDGIAIPLHQGAEKFYREAGMIR